MLENIEYLLKNDESRKKILIRLSKENFLNEAALDIFSKVFSEIFEIGKLTSALETN